MGKAHHRTICLVTDLFHGAESLMELKSTPIRASNLESAQCARIVKHCMSNLNYKSGWIQYLQ